MPYGFRGPMNTESESGVATVDAFLDEYLYMTSESYSLPPPSTISYGQRHPSG